MSDPISMLTGQFGTTGFLTGGIFSTMWLWVKIILGTALIALGGGMLYKNIGKYNIYVLVKEREGETGTYVRKDKARYMVDEQGKRKIVLKSFKLGKEHLSCPKPEAKYRQSVKTSWGKKDYYELWLDDSGALSPIMPPKQGEADFKLNVIPEDRKAWQHMETKLNQEKYKKNSFFERYQQVIVLGLTLIVVFLMVFFTIQHISGMVEQVSRSVSDLASAVTSLGG